MKEMNRIYELLLKVTEQQKQIRILNGAITVEMSELYKLITVLETELLKNTDIKYSNELNKLNKVLDDMALRKSQSVIEMLKQ